MSVDQSLTLTNQPYVLSNLTVPTFLCGPKILADGRSEMVQCNLGVSEGRISKPAPGWPVIDASRLMALPPFVDAHVHLDKAYTVQRTGLGDGTLLGAIRVAVADMPNWTSDDLKARMRHGAYRALANGTGLIRTHLDTAMLPDETPSWDMLDDLRDEMSGVQKIQPVALTALERAEQPDFGQRCTQIARRGGVLGAFIPPGPVAQSTVRKLLAAADRHGLDVDFHVDENLAPGPPALGIIADIMIETGHQTRVVAGHCCNLSLLDYDDQIQLMARVAQAGIHCIALPLTNLFLQDRNPDKSPRRRGIAPLREMLAQGVPVSTASDNVQDAFYPFGDFDMLEVLRTMIVSGHLEQELNIAMALGFDGGARAMGFDNPRIELGAPADFTLFNACNWIDLLAQPQTNRVIVRSGEAISEINTQFRGVA